MPFKNIPARRGIKNIAEFSKKNCTGDLIEKKLDFSFDLYYNIG